MIEKIRYKVSKVLPLVYDDALSYYEALSKLITVVNECIDSCNETEAAVDSLSTTVTNQGSTIETLQNSVSSINGELTTIDDRLDGIDSNLTDLADDVAALPTEATVLYEHYIEADNDEAIQFYSTDSDAPTSLTNLKFKLRKALSLFVAADSNWCYILNMKDILSEPEGIRVYYVGFTSGDPVFKYKDITFTGGTITDTVTQL